MQVCVHALADGGKVLVGCNKRKAALNGSVNVVLGAHSQPSRQILHCQLDLADERLADYEQVLHVIPMPSAASTVSVVRLVYSIITHR